MKKIFFIAGMMLFGAVWTPAQDKTTEKSPDNFLWDFTTGTFGFYLPQDAVLHDKVSIKNNKGVEVKSVTINDALLRSGKYTMPINSLSAGDYTIAVIHNDEVLYSFLFGNKEKAVAKTHQELATLSKTAAADNSFSVNPNTGMFVIATATKINEGTLLEVFNRQEQLIAKTTVGQEMIEKKQYSIKAGPLENGAYSIKIGGQNFGRVAVNR